MNRKVLLGVGAAVLGVAAFGILTADAVAAFSIQYADNSTVLQSVCVLPLADGGADAVVSAYVPSADGGGQNYGQPATFSNLTGANRTSALDIMAKGKSAWNVVNGFAP